MSRTRAIIDRTPAVAWLTLACLAVTGCASIVSESRYPVTISSDPSGAEIRIVNRSGEEVYAGTTPATVTLEAGAGYFKGERYTVSFSKAGHPSSEARIERGLDGWYIGGNLFLGGLIGWLIVDPATGAMWTLEDLHVDLLPDRPDRTPRAGATLNILSIEDVPADERADLQPVTLRHDP